MGMRWTANYRPTWLVRKCRQHGVEVGERGDGAGAHNVGRLVVGAPDVEAMLKDGKGWWPWLVAVADCG